jgi:hypothetical protein
MSAGQVTRKPIIWQNAGLNVCPYHQDFLGRNHQEINKGKQKFEFQKIRPAYKSRLRASKAAIESMTEPEVVMMVEVTWMQPYLAYMVNKTLPEDVVEARRIVR